MTMQQETSRPEAAFVLMLLQATFWAMAGISALPFVLGGEVVMVGLAAVSIAVAGGAVVLAAGVVQRRLWARRWSLVIEWICLVAAVLQLALPLAVVLLLLGKGMRARFGITTATNR